MGYFHSDDRHIQLLFHLHCELRFLVATWQDIRLLISTIIIFVGLNRIAQIEATGSHPC